MGRARLRAMKDQRGQSEAADRLSPSRPVTAPHSSAVLELSAEEYDAFVANLEGPSEPSEALRRTMSLHPLPRE